MSQSAVLSLACLPGRSGQAFIFLEADGRFPSRSRTKSWWKWCAACWALLPRLLMHLRMSGLHDTRSFEGSNSILIVGGSNVAWPAEVVDFQRPITDAAARSLSQADLFRQGSYRGRVPSYSNKRFQSTSMRRLDAWGPWSRCRRSFSWKGCLLLA